MKFLLVGNGGFYNRGCEAIASMTVGLLKEHFKDAEIILSSFTREDCQIKFPSEVRFIYMDLEKIWKVGSREWFLRQYYKCFKKDRSWSAQFLSLRHDLWASDLVFSIGGDNYSSDYSSLRYYLDLNRLVKDANKKLIIWAASIGPFKVKDSELKEIVNSLKSVDLITVRETSSLEYLKELGISKNVRLTADPAFLLPKEVVPLDSFTKQDRGWLGFNISPILKNYTDGMLDNEMLLKSAARFLEKVSKEMELKIILVPHSMRPNHWDNDYTFMKELQRELSPRLSIDIVPPIFNASQLKYIISRCRFFIGGRTHSTIAALSNKVPTLSISYSQKSKGINKDIYNSLDYLIDIKDLNQDFFYQKFSKLYKDESSIRDLLSRQIPKFEQLARVNVDYLRELL